MAWLFMPFGILMPAIRPPWSIDHDNPDAEPHRTLQVRVRDVRHLEPLREVMGDKLGPTRLTPNFDYEARAYCTHEDFAWAMGEIFKKIDYDRFKPTTHRYPKTDGQLHGFYTSVWSTMLNRLSTSQHKKDYAAGATVADVQAAAGSTNINVPSFVPPTRREPWSDYKPRTPWTGADEIAADSTKEFWDEFDRLQADDDSKTVLFNGVVPDEDDPEYLAAVTAKESDMDDLVEQLPEGYLELPEAERKEIFEAFDAAEGVTQEQWEAYVAVRSGSAELTAYLTPEDPESFSGVLEVPYDDETRSKQQDPANDWFFDGIKAGRIEHGTPFPNNPDAERRLLTALFDPESGSFGDDDTEYLSIDEVADALRIWRRKRFRTFMRDHEEWGVYNDMRAHDLPEIKAEWKRYKKGQQA